MSPPIKNFREGNITYENGILSITYCSKITINENKLYKQFMNRKSLSHERDILIIVNLNKDTTVADDAIAFVASYPCQEHIKAIAFVTKSDVDCISTKLLAAFDKPNVNIKVFLSDEEARFWFKCLKQNNFVGKAC